MVIQKNVILKDLVEKCQPYLEDTPSRSYFPFFIQGLFYHIALKTLSRKNPEWLQVYALDAWNNFQKPPVNFSQHISHNTLHVGHAPSDTLSIINVDRPFLYDTLKIFLDQKNLKPEFFCHPVWFVKRDQQGALLEIHNSETKDQGCWESFIYLTFKKQIDLPSWIDSLKDTLSYVHQVVHDWQPMLNSVTSLANRLSIHPNTQEAANYLTWLIQGHFVFLGSRYYPLDASHGDRAVCVEDATQHLGILNFEHFSQSISLIPSLIRAHPSNLRPLQPLTALKYHKTDFRSPVHRLSRINSMEVLDQDDQGQIKGIHQFVGLFTRASFTRDVFDIPVIGKKARHAFQQFGIRPDCFDGKLLISIINSIPQDELFALDEDELFQMVEKILHARDDGNVSLFLRQDPFEGFTTAIIYMPQERYSFEVKERFSKILPKTLGGHVSSAKALINDLPFARLIFIISHKPKERKPFDTNLLEQELGQATLSWEDLFHIEIPHLYEDDKHASIIDQYSQAFGTDYQENFPVSEALMDLEHLQQLKTTHPLSLRFYRLDAEQPLRLKIYYYGMCLSLSDLLPILHHLGLKPTAETTFEIKPHNRKSAWVHDFEFDDPPALDLQDLMAPVYEAFLGVWNGLYENDVLNQLVIRSGLSARQINLLRAYVYYLRQIRIPYSLPYIHQTLIDYPEISKALVHLFEGRFANTKTPHASVDDIRTMFKDVQRLDHDKILRRLLNLILCTLRTNYTQTEKPYLAFKLEAQKITQLPEPRPLYEIFVYSPRFQAIHLRSGKVARGGIRWSDRPEDFRTEILGLMKAQVVKNSVIVPLGSKGGFVLSHPEKFPDRKDLQGEVIACYEQMMHALLELTDNLSGDKIIPPQGIVRFDDDDPYLVVAADKGTATFSDLANKISQEHGFWLDDAFASGGSSGYDHKKIAITSRGAWESVKRHFWELGFDTQHQNFTVIGVGDMAGDVFGNGMLRSECIQLIGAFNHLHIFLDPEPDPKASFQERQRLFNLPGSAWTDYNLALISKGGGIFSRSDKEIPISPEIRQRLGIQEDVLAPEDLIKILLKAPVDLLFFGGIGTFIKGQNESHLEAGDPQNDALRVDGREIQATIIAEGANLGVTQRGRIEYALKGGKVNTDFIDNSAGVDCSDHEVNIKILFQRIMASQSLNRTTRDKILKDMTDDVAKLVLRDNFLQTRALSMMSCLGNDGWSRWQNLFRYLESEIKLNRALEGLPDDETIDRRQTLNQPITRPELAVILSHSKILLFNNLLDHEILDDPIYDQLLLDYFPKQLKTQFPDAILAHPLRREIIATSLSNQVVNEMGASFVPEHAQFLGCQPAVVVDYYFKLYQTLGLRSLWKDIDDLFGQIPTEIQYAAYAQIQQTMEDLVNLLAHECIDFKDSEDHLNWVNIVSPWIDPHVLSDAREKWALLPEPIQNAVAILPYLPAYLVIQKLSRLAQVQDQKIAQTYFKIQQDLLFENVHQSLKSIKRQKDWQESMVRQLMQDMILLEGRLILNIIVDKGQESLKSWQDKLHDIKPHLIALQNKSDLSYLSFVVGQLKNRVFQETSHMILT